MHLSLALLASIALASSGASAATPSPSSSSKTKSTSTLPPASQSSTPMVAPSCASINTFVPPFYYWTYTWTYTGPKALNPKSVSDPKHKPISVSFDGSTALCDALLRCTVFASGGDSTTPYNSYNLLYKKPTGNAKVGTWVCNAYPGWSDYAYFNSTAPAGTSQSYGFVANGGCNMNYGGCPYPEDLAYSGCQN